MLNVLEAGAGSVAPAIDLSTVDFGPVTATITSVIPQALTFVVGVLAIRKGISFLMGLVRGA